MSFISPVATDASGNARTTGSQQTLGKDDFLQLLVTKLQNQDPMNPTDDESFIAELAQFSSLEQMNNISDNIAQLSSYSLLQMQSTTNATAANLIGKEVKADYSSIYLSSSGNADISFTMAEPAAEVTFTIKDAEGNVVATFTEDSVGSGVKSVEWDGTNVKGARQATGAYTVEVTATRTSGSSFTPSLSITGTVTKVTYRDGTAYVTVDGTEVPLSDIVSVGDEGSLTDN